MNKKNKFGMLSVKAGIDNNPNPTQADRIAGAKRKMAYGGKAQRKGYAYGSMVRSPMNPETSMTSMFNPMQPRQQGMNRGGKIKSHEQQESPAFERMEKKSKGYMD